MNVQKYLQFKYAVESCASLQNLHGSMYKQQTNANSQQMSGNPLSFVSLYQHSSLSRCAAWSSTAAIPLSLRAEKRAALNSGARVLHASHDGQDTDVLHSLCAPKTQIVRDVNTKHGNNRDSTRSSQQDRLPSHMDLLLVKLII